MVDEGLEVAAERVADRWTVMIVSALLDGPRRFTDLVREIDGIAPNTLSSRLSGLEASGLVVSTPYQDRPERFRYDLTEPGRDLRQVVMALQAWSHRHGTGDGPRHAVCGTGLELTWYCPECDRPATTNDPADEATWV